MEVEMLKVIGRLVAILLVIGLLTAGVYWLGQSYPTLLTLGAGAGRRGFEGALSAGAPGDRPARSPDAPPGGREGRGLRGQGGFGEGGHEFGGGSAAGALGILRNVGIIGLITLGVAGIQKAAALISRRRAAAPPRA
jgi:hypothetical protein